MDQTLKDVKNTSAYLDNILSHAVLFKDQISNIRACFKNLIVSEIGMSPSSENIKKVKEYSRPGNAKELKRFLRLANYYRDFMTMFAGRAEPLY